MKEIEEIFQRVEAAEQEAKEAEAAFHDSVSAYNQDRTDKDKEIASRARQLEKQLESIEEQRANDIKALAEASIHGGDTKATEKELEELGQRKASNEQQLQAVRAYKSEGSEALAKAVKEAFDNMITARTSWREIAGQAHTQADKILDQVKKDVEKLLSASMNASRVAREHRDQYGVSAELVKVFENQYGEIEVPQEQKYMAGIYKAEQAQSFEW